MDDTFGSVGAWFHWPVLVIGEHYKSSLTMLFFHLVETSLTLAPTGQQQSGRTRNDCVAGLEPVHLGCLSQDLLLTEWFTGLSQNNTIIM